MSAKIPRPSHLRGVSSAPQFPAPRARIASTSADMEEDRRHAAAANEQQNQPQHEHSTILYEALTSREAAKDIITPSEQHQLEDINNSTAPQASTSREAATDTMTPSEQKQLEDVINSPASPASTSSGETTDTATSSEQVQLEDIVNSSASQAATPQEAATDAMTRSEQKQLEDVNMKIQIAKAILEACELEKHLRGLRFPIPSNPQVKRFSGYVGSKYQGLFHDKDIQKSATRKRTLATMLENKKCETNYFYEKIREVIIDTYVKDRMLPSRCLLLSKNKMRGISERIPLNQYLKMAGFVWTPLPKLRKCILVEKPELASAKFHYLKQMLKFRSESRPIVYLEEGNHNTCDVAYELKPNNIFVIAASNEGVIAIDFVPVLDEDHNDYLEEFIEKIGYLLPSRCVLVLNERPHHVRKTVPTEFSSRKEMIDWLKACKIPFEETMHSGELFALIQRFKNNFPSVKFRCEDIAKKFDVEVVYKPYLMILNFFKDVNIVTSRLKKRTRNILLGLKNENIDWKSLENDLIATEQKIFEEDMKLEVIIDKLMTMASDRHIYPDMVKHLSDSKEEGCSSTNMSDVVIL